MRDAAVALLLAGALGCSTSGSSGGSAGPTCVSQTASDGGVFYQCLGGTWSQCPVSAEPTEPCGNAGVTRGCMGCSDGVGYTCACQDSGVETDQDAALWLCAGTGYTCR